MPSVIELSDSSSSFDHYSCVLSSSFLEELNETNSEQTAKADIKDEARENQDNILEEEHKENTEESNNKEAIKQITEMNYLQFKPILERNCLLESGANAQADEYFWRAWIADALYVTPKSKRKSSKRQLSISSKTKTDNNREKISGKIPTESNGNIIQGDGPIQNEKQMKKSIDHPEELTNLNSIPLPHNDNDKESGQESRRKKKEISNKRSGQDKPTSKSTKVKIKNQRNWFANHREIISYDLYREFNLNVFQNKLPVDLKLVWSVYLHKTAGRAHFKKTSGSSESKDVVYWIELSVKVLDDLDRLKCTLAHEMCHLAAWIIEGCYKPAHGKKWKKWVHRVHRFYQNSIVISVKHNYEIHYKHKYKCQNSSCNRIYKRHSKIRDFEIKKCGCGGLLKENDSLEI